MGIRLTESRLGCSRERLVCTALAAVMVVNGKQQINMKPKHSLIANLLVCVLYIASWIWITHLGTTNSFRPIAFAWSYFPLWMLANIRPAALADGLMLLANGFVLVTFVATYGLMGNARLSIAGYALCVSILMALTIRRQIQRRNSEIPKNGVGS